MLIKMFDFNSEWDVVTVECDKVYLNNTGFVFERDGKVIGRVPSMDEKIFEIVDNK